MTKEKVKQLVAAVAVAGTIGVGFAVNHVTQLNQQIALLQETKTKLTQENVNLTVERDNLKQCVKSLEEAGKSEATDTENQVSEIASSEEIMTVQQEPISSVAYDGGTYLGTFSATFYHCGGLTALGDAADESVIAVDPSVIPLGNYVYIEVEGHPEFSGIRKASDVGGAIVGSRIDICSNYIPDEGVCTTHVYLIS